MPDLGKYADAVIWSYIASLVLIIGVVALSLWQNARAKRALAEAEARQNRAGGAQA
jgi:heme exporter protein D